METPPGAEVVIDGRPYLYFGGTSYLALHGHPEVIEAGVAALRRHGVHSGTTRAGFGTIAPVLAVEQRAAEYFDREEAFYFSTGYVSNHILIQALRPQADRVFVEEGAHFCVVEAARVAGLPCHTFGSRDPAALARALAAHLQPGERPLVMGDAVAPPTGELAPVAAYLELLARHAPATLLLDDAHGFGVLGEHGRGLYEQLGLWPHVNTGAPGPGGVTLTVGGTLAKALGGFGGIIPGSAAFMAGVRGASHYFDGASAPASAAAGSSAHALALVRREPAFRQRLRANVEQLRAGLAALGLALPDSPAAVIGVRAGARADMLRLHTGLKARGILVPYLASYSGLGGQGILRFAVSAAHTPAMVEQLLTTLKPML